MSRSRRSTSATNSSLSTRDVLFFAVGVVVTVCSSQYMSMQSNYLFDVNLMQEWNQKEGETTTTTQVSDNDITLAAASTHTYNAQISAQDVSGFHPLHLYFGNNDLLWPEIPADKFWIPSPTWTKPGNRKWFSQHGQDVAVMKVLDYARDGFFVDLAANDAVWASNTYTLEQHFGWRGICIEANPMYWYKLGFRHCHAVGAVVGNSTANVPVQVLLQDDKIHGPYGGIVGEAFDNKKPKKEPVTRYTVPLATILERFQAPAVIDYLSLDVEGAEWYILEQFPWERYQFKCLTIERPSDDLQALLQRHGYVKILDIARGDTLWVHQSLGSQAEQAVQVNPQEIKDHISPNLPTHAIPK